jgi:hypothetical protein
MDILIKIYLEMINITGGYFCIMKLDIVRTYFLIDKKCTIKIKKIGGKKMTEHQLFTLISQLSMQKMAQGNTDPIKAINESAKIVDEMVKMTKKIMDENDIPTQKEIIELSMQAKEKAQE